MAHNEHVTTPERDFLAEIPRLSLPPLEETASREILTDRCPVGVSADLAAGLTELTGGNPLALVELATALTPGQLSGEDVTSGDETPGSTRYATWYSACDGVIIPYTSTELNGATNNNVACQTHIGYLTDTVVLTQVRTFLGT